VRSFVTQLAWLLWVLSATLIVCFVRAGLNLMVIPHIREGESERARQNNNGALNIPGSIAGFLVL
jgi:hypothetical protein